jgi:esterase/lipase
MLTEQPHSATLARIFLHCRTNFGEGEEKPMTVISSLRDQTKDTLLKMVAENEYVDLVGDPKLPTVLFFHGLGSSILDLLPLAHSFSKSGYPSRLVQLKGHGDDWSKLGEATLDDILQDSLEAFKELNKEKVIVVGFSLGALLALDIATRETVEGVLGISTFFEFKHHWLPNGINKLTRRNARLPFRLLNVTKTATKRELRYAKTIPLDLYQEITDFSETLKKKMCEINAPVLLLQSIDDGVSSFDAVANSIRQCRGSKKDMVTFYHLKHFLQFDIPAECVRDVALDYFGTPETDDKWGKSFDVPVSDRYREMCNESRHWSKMVFTLVVGFFTIFGALLYSTLPEVMKGDPNSASYSGAATIAISSAPYYLLFYSNVINTYILCSGMYLFYLNRAESYIKHFVEPECGPFPWVHFRTSSRLSGNLSPRITTAVAMITICLPLLSSLSILIYTVNGYAERLFTINPRNTMLILLFISAMATLFMGIRNAIHLHRFTRRHLYRTVQPLHSSKSFNGRMSRMFSSVDPGCVRQPLAEK